MGLFANKYSLLASVSTESNTRPGHNCFGSGFDNHNAGGHPNEISLSVTLRRPAPTRRSRTLSASLTNWEIILRDLWGAILPMISLCSAKIPAKERLEIRLYLEE
jgi:hypothetical protein